MSVEQFEEFLFFLQTSNDVEALALAAKIKQLGRSVTKENGLDFIDLQFTMPSGNYYHASGEFFYNKNTDKYEEKVQDVDGKVYKVEW